jgi:diguanylate cyclase (GGDEF)-like protein
MSPSPEASVAVVDLPSPPGLPLADSVRAARFGAQPLADVDQLLARLGDPAGAPRIAVLAFEALCPQPQEKLQRLRERGAGCQLVVALEQGSPRVRLAQRLWSAGAMDFLVDRAIPYGEFAQVLQAAAAGAQSHAEHGAPRPGTKEDDSGRQLDFLQTLFSTLASQRSVAEVLRAFRMTLPRALPFAALQVFLHDQDSYWGTTFPVRPVPHALMWALLERSAQELSARTGKPLSPEALTVRDPEPASGPDGGAGKVSSWASVVLPLQAAEETFGTLGLLLDATQAQDPRTLRLLTLVSFSLAAALRQARMLELAEQASLTDALTGCQNRRALTAQLDAEWRRAVRYNLQLSVAMVDVDHFKQLNDVYGHVAGDQVLVGLARFLKSRLRETDTLVRYGGEEFAILLPETGPAEAAMVLERIRILASGQSFHSSQQHGPVQVAFSVGIAGFPASPVSSPEALVQEADKALYEAKNAGRDRVCIAALPEDGGAGVVAAGQPNDLRAFPRVPVRMSVRLLELTDFESRMSQVIAGDISAGGISISGRGMNLKKEDWALVYLEDAQKPMLTRVAWTQVGPDGDQKAGLRYVRTDELSQMVRASHQRQGAVRTLVMVEQPVTRAMVARVLRAAQHDFLILEPDDPLPDDAGGFELAVVGEGMLRRRNDFFSRLGERTRVVMVNEGSGRKEALGALLSHQVRHMVSVDQSGDEALFATLSKLILGEYFGVRKYLLWGAQLRSWSIVDHDSKTEALHGISRFALEVNCHPRVKDLFLMAVDEMIINALYRAPPDGAPGRPVAVECGSDGRLLVISVMDKHGRFKPENLYAGLARALDHEQQGIPSGATQANLGFKIMLDALSHLAINLEPGHRTEVIGIVDLRKSLRDHRQSVPGLNVFTR